MDRAEQLADFRRRALEVTTLAYEGSNAWALRDLAVPLILDLLAELDAWGKTFDAWASLAP